MVKKIVSNVQQQNENDARRGLLEDLFFDFNRKRSQVYWINFTRGIFFGVGTVIGGTLVIGLVIWMLNWLVDIPGGFGDFIQYIVDTVQNR
jgi:Domain of unknown function (DUF5665)